MGCHAPCEDDDGGFLVAAQEDATLVAHLLLRLSRCETYAPWRQFREPASPSAGAADDHHPLPDPPKWGKRRARSRCLTMEPLLAAKREDAWRASPTTPLSWSGGSWTSGSVCESTPARPPKRQHGPDSPPCHDVEPPPPAKGCKPGPHEHGVQVPAPPSCRSRKTEATCNRDGACHGVLAAGWPAPAGSASGPGSTKAGAVGGPPRAVAHVEPLRMRLTGERVNSVAVRRPGKKKTVPELRALKESLLQEQVELRKDLEEQKMFFEALLKENIRLKNLESSLASQTVGEPDASPAAREEAESEEPQQPQTVKGPSTGGDPPRQLLCTRPPTCLPQRAPLFDLNCPPDDPLF